jgi:hypothetical protein
VAVPLFPVGRLDLARAFYTQYVASIHAEMKKDYSKAGLRDRLATSLATGKKKSPEGYQAFRDLVDAQWQSVKLDAGLEREPSVVAWLISKKSPGWFVPESHVLRAVSLILDEVFDGATSKTARQDLRSNTARLVDPMSAQDFYTQYLRAAHAEYKSAFSFTNMDETNDFAESLATGRRADEVGYEALRYRLKEVSGGADVLGDFRNHWNYYLRLATGHGGDTPIETKNGERTVKGKTQSQWKSAAEDSMSKVSDALDKAF